MKASFLFLLSCLFSFAAIAQVKIGDNPATIKDGSLLELESTTKGLLLPRVTTTQMNAIPTTGGIAGMVVFNTDSNSLCQYANSVWTKVSVSNRAWLVVGTNRTADLPGDQTAAIWHSGNTVFGNNAGSTTPDAGRSITISNVVTSANHSGDNVGILSNSTFTGNAGQSFGLPAAANLRTEITQASQANYPFFRCLTVDARNNSLTSTVLFEQSGINLASFAQNGGVINTNAGLQVFTGAADGATIPVNYGIRLRGPDFGSDINKGTLTHSYGIFLGNMAGSSKQNVTNSWGIFQNGALDNNFFAGKTVIGRTSSETGNIALNGGFSVAPTATAPRATLDVFGTDGIIVPVGTTGERPTTPVQGTIRYNTTTGNFEGYNGSAWVALN